MIAGYRMLTLSATERLDLQVVSEAEDLQGPGSHALYHYIVGGREKETVKSFGKCEPAGNYRLSLRETK